MAGFLHGLLHCMCLCVVACVLQEIGNYHMRIADGVATLLQIQALCSQVYLICNKGG